MRKFSIAGNPSAADDDGLASPVTGATFALTSTVVAADDMAHKVAILNNSANDHSGKTLTITGKAFGVQLTETITAPGSSATVNTVNYYETVSSITVSATIGSDTFDLGWLDDAATEPVWINSHREGPFECNFACVILDGDSPTYEVQETYGDPLATWFAHATVTAETTNQTGKITGPLRAFRLEISAAGHVAMSGVMTE